MTLLELEKLRKSVASKSPTNKIQAFFVALVIVVVLFFGLFFRFVTTSSWDSALFRLGVGLGVLVLFYVLYSGIEGKLIHSKSREFREKFKEMYLVPYFQNLGYSYFMHSHVNAVYLVKSELFPRFATQRGNDEIRGEKNGVFFTFSDIVLEDIEEIEDSGYSNSVMIARWIYSNFGTDKLYPDEKSKFKLFEGLFFMADFNKNITSRTFVMQNANPRVKRGLKLIKMDNPTFNTKFKVFSDDIQNAMYILSPALMERINTLSNTLKNPINISFIDSKIFISVETGRDSFEPNLEQSIITKNPATQIKRELDAILGIVEVLSLDANLWAKMDKNQQKKSQNI